MSAAATSSHMHIVTDPKTLSGLPHIAGTRIRVLDIVALLHEGLEPIEMLDSYEQLSLGQIHAALSYYHDHEEEVERSFETERARAEEFRRTHPELCR